MRTLGLATLAVGLAALLPGSLDAAGARPALRIVDTDPLTLSGRAFRAHELVRLVVEPEPGEARVRKVRVNDTGRFTLSFQGLRLNRCSGSLEVTATGSKGSKVSFTLNQLHCGDRADS